MNKKKILILSLIMVGIILLGAGTYAYYMIAIKGNIKIETGTFVFDVLHNNTTFTNIDLYDTIENPRLTNKYIIPGDSGKFELIATVNGSSTDVEYEITFTGTNIPTNLKFYLNKQKTNKLDLTKSLKGYFNSDDTDKTKVYTIYWEWPYDSGVNNSDDINYQNKDILVDVKVVGKQSPGHAIMMNGDITEHSDKTTTVGMWKAEYRTAIKTITFSNDLSVLPTECTEANLCWDITDTESAYPVYHYLVQNETDTTKYDAYIVSEEKIYAPKDSSGLFELSKYESNNYISSLESINFNNNFDTSKVTNMYAMFATLINLNSLDVSNFNTVNVTNMSQLFYSCAALPELDVSSFDTSKVTDMSYMFMYLKEIINLDLSSFDTSKVTDMRYMFAQCLSLTSLDLSNFNTSKVINMASMFNRLYSIKSINLSNFDTSKVTNMGSLFQGSTVLETIDLSNFDTSNVTNMRAMFGGISASGDMHLKEIKVSDKFVTDNVTDMLEMFRLCRYLNFTFNVTGNKVTNYTNIFSNTATDSNAKIVVNYTAETETLVDNMLATKSSGSNVVKGKQI